MRRAARPLVLIVSLAAAAPLAAATGSLSIESQPGVEVVWDGTPIGRTDEHGTMLIEGIPPGEYVLDLSKVGHRSQRQRVVVTEEPASYHGYLELLEPIEPIEPSNSPEPEPPVSAEPTPLPTERAALPEGELVDTPSGQPASQPEVTVPPNPSPAPEEAIESVEGPLAVEEPSPLPAPEIIPLAAESGGGRGLGQVFLVLGVALFGGLAIFFTGRRSSSVSAARVRKAPEILLEKTVSETDDSRFIESLKQRERALDDSSSGAGQVIDVEIIDIQEIEGDA